MARTIWASIFADPARAVNLKASDHFAVATYCKLQAILAALKSPPPPTFEKPVVVTERDKDGNKTERVVGSVTKHNPAYGAWLATIREARALEEKLGMNPIARVSLERSLGKPADPPEPDAATRTPAAGSAGRKPSPLGALKTNPRVN